MSRNPRPRCASPPAARSSTIRCADLAFVEVARAGTWQAVSAGAPWPPWAPRRRTGVAGGGAPGLRRGRSARLPGIWRVPPPRRQWTAPRTSRSPARAPRARSPVARASAQDDGAIPLQRRGETRNRAGNADRRIARRRSGRPPRTASRTSYRPCCGERIFAGSSPRACGTLKSSVIDRAALRHRHGGGNRRRRSPESQGSTTLSTRAVTTAASMALPPRARTAAPASAAWRFCAATRPCGRADGRLVNGEGLHQRSASEATLRDVGSGYARHAKRSLLMRMCMMGRESRRRS